MIRQAFVCAALALAGAHAQELKTASRHAIQYYLSLPEGWSAAKKWPVVVAIESANRDFQGNAAVFTQARGAAPWIIVSPIVVTGGGAGFRDVPTYRYTNAIWAEIDRMGQFEFDRTGIDAIMADLQRLYHAEDRYFLTGWEAGGHTVWALLFQHPEKLRAAAPVSTNYLGRWMTPEAFSTAPERARLPVKVFQAAQVPSPYFARQTQSAIDLAREHGFRNISLERIDKPHGPLAEDVLRWFAAQ